MGRPKYRTTPAEREIIRAGGTAAVVLVETILKRELEFSDRADFSDVLWHLLHQPGHNPDIYAKARKMLGEE